MRLWLGVPLAFALCTLTASAAVSVLVVKSAYPLLVSNCGLSGSASEAGTPDYYSNFSATYKNSGSRAIATLLVKFTILSGSKTVATRTLIDSRALAPGASAAGQWRVVGYPASFDGATCTISAVRYQ
jgi:hypothetical protein